MEFQLTWKQELPTEVNCYYLCAYHGEIHVMFVTQRDIDLVNSILPEWLGPTDAMWAGPIPSPFKE